MSPEASRPEGLIISDGVIRQYNGSDIELTTPEDVRGIDGAVFSGSQTLSSIVLNEGLEIIGKRCFENCSELKTVTLPRSLRKIGEYAFADCHSLKYIRIPEGLQKIDAYVFKNCFALKSVRLSDSVTEIEVGAFLNCRNLESVHIPETVTDFTNIFGQHPFTGCEKLKIYTPAGSPAEEFAKENDITFVNVKTYNPPVNKRHNEDYGVSPEIPPVPTVTVQSGSVLTLVDPGSPAMKRMMKDTGAAEKQGGSIAPQGQTEKAEASSDQVHNIEATKASDASERISAFPSVKSAELATKKTSETPPVLISAKPEDTPANSEKVSGIFGNASIVNKQNDNFDKLGTASDGSDYAEKIDPVQAEAQRKTAIYAEAMDLFRNGDEGSIRSAVELMRSIYPYSDSGKRLKEFDRMLRTEQDYNEAIRCLEAGDKASLKRAIKLFKSLDGYREASLGLKESRARLQELKNGRKTVKPAADNAVPAEDKAAGANDNAQKPEAESAEAAGQAAAADPAATDQHAASANTALSSSESNSFDRPEVHKPAAGSSASAAQSDDIPAYQDPVANKYTVTSSSAEAIADEYITKPSSSDVYAAAPSVSDKYAAKAAVSDEYISAPAASDKYLTDAAASDDYRVTRSESRIARSGYPEAPKPKPARRSHTGRTVFLIILIILLLAAAAAAVFYLYSIGKDVDTNSNTAGDEAQEKITTDYSATLEDFVKYNSDARAQIEQSVDGTNVSVNIDGNTLVYLYDLSETEGLTEETAESDEVKSSLEATLDSGDDNFIELCKSLETDTGISGITVEIRYIFGEKTVLSRKYTVEGKQ